MRSSQLPCQPVPRLADKPPCLKHHFLISDTVNRNVPRALGSETNACARHTVGLRNDKANEAGHKHTGRASSTHLSGIQLCLYSSGDAHTPNTKCRNEEL